MDAVKVTEPPWQKVVAPDAVMAAVATTFCLLKTISSNLNKPVPLNAPVTAISISVIFDRLIVVPNADRAIRAFV